MLHTYTPDNIDQNSYIMDTCFASAAYVSKVTIDCSWNMSPSALVFQQAMILNISLVLDLLQLHEQQQIIIDQLLQHSSYVLEHLAINLAMKY